MTDFNKITLFPDHVDRSDSWITIAQELYDLQIMIKTLSAKEEELKKVLRALSDNRSSKGGDYVYTLNERQGSIQYKDIEILKGLNLEKYRSYPVAIWKLIKV